MSSNPKTIGHLTAFGWVAVAFLAAFQTTLPAGELPTNSASHDAHDPARCVVTSGPVTLTVTLDPPQVHVAEPIGLAIQVDAPKGYRIKMPAVPESFGTLQVLTTTDIDNLPVGDQLQERRWLRRMTLESITTGELTFPTLEVLYAPGHSEADESGQFRSIRSEPLVVRVASVLEDRADLRAFRDIKDVVDIDLPPPPSRSWIGWTLGALVSIALIAIASTLAARRRYVTPTRWALAEIARLEESERHGQADTAEIYGQLADITREFMECTSISLSEPRTASLLAMADEVKFARRQPDTDQLRDAIDQIRRFIVEYESNGGQFEKESA